MKICVATMVGPGASPHAAWESVKGMVDGVVDTAPGEITDFAAARNELLDQSAFMGYDWALMLDTDEQIVWERDFTDEDLREALDWTPHDVLMVQQADGTYAKERIFRLPMRGRYHGPTHEAFLLGGGSSRGMLEGITFTEDPKTPEQYRAKAERDDEILTRWLLDIENSEDPRWWYYLGDTRAGLGDRNGARIAFRRCYDRNGWDEEGAWAAFRIASLYAEEQDWVIAIEWCAKGMIRRADFPELPWLAGWCCYQQGKYEQAIAWSRLALAYSADPHALIYPETQRVIFRHPPAHYESPYDVIRWSLRQLGEDPDQAEGFFKVSLAKRQKSER